MHRESTFSPFCFVNWPKTCTFVPDMNPIIQPKDRCRWRRFSHKGYAPFQSLHREVSIGVLGVAMLGSCTYVRPPGQIQQPLQQGDLLFCIEAGESQGLGSAIAAVTEGIDRQSITHVAIVVDTITVLEASPHEGVRVIHLSDFLAEADHGADGRPLVLAGRLRDTTGVALSVQRALQYVGRPYDWLYQPTDSAIYCSELVQLSYRRPDGSDIFAPEPMSFSDSTGHIAPYWQQHYAEQGLAVPEGEPGTNPGALSRHEALIIHYEF